MKKIEWKETPVWIQDGCSDIINEEIDNIKKVLISKKIAFKDTLGDIGEKFMFWNLIELFGEKNVEKIKEQKDKTPDFKIILNDKEEIKIENKTLVPQIPFHEIILDIMGKYENKIKSKDFDCSPANLHFEDIEKIKEYILSAIENNFPEKNAKLKLNKEYTITIQENMFGQGAVFGGRILKADSGVWNQISDKEEQIQRADVLSVVMLNKFVYGENLYKSFYPVTLDASTGKNILNYNCNPWKKISHLRFVLVLYPQQKEIFFLHNIDDSIKIETKFIMTLKRGFEKSGFKFYEMDKYSYFDRENLNETTK